MSAPFLLGLVFLMLLGMGVLIGLALIGLAATGLFVWRDIDIAAFLAGDVWRSLTAPELAALPLFVLMGEILSKSRVAERLFKGLAPLLAPLPGGLLHSNVLGATLFAAISGSSAATTATVGRITLPELEARGYDRKLAIGSLCGAGTLGFLIPPSIVLILYGVLANVSILKLFLAGIVPGLMLAGLYMLLAGILGRRSPRPASGSMRGKIAALPHLLPVLLLIIAVLGALWSGLAGPTEAAIIGVAGALVLSAFEPDRLRRLRAAFLAAVRSSSMLGLVLAGAFFLSKVAALFALPESAAHWVDDLGLPPLLLILMLMLLYSALGMLLDGLSLMVATLPVTLPMVVAAGYDPLWFGIFLVVIIEMAQITPPVGFNLFVARDLTGEPLLAIARAALPFFLVTAAFALLLALFPGIVTFPLN